MMMVKEGRGNWLENDCAIWANGGQTGSLMGLGWAASLLLIFSTQIARLFAAFWPRRRPFVGDPFNEMGFGP
jgi:hypothetical protein